MAAATNCEHIARLPNVIKSVAIERADVPIKRFYLVFFLDSDIVFIVSNNIDVYMSANSDIV